MSLLFCFHNVRVRTMYISAHQINHIFLSAGRVLKELPQWRAGQTFIYKCKHKQQTKQVETTKNETETMINSTTFNADNNNLQWFYLLHKLSWISPSAVLCKVSMDYAGS